jgi:RNA polymerase primary sigma factor
MSWDPCRPRGGSAEIVAKGLRDGGPVRLPRDEEKRLAEAVRKGDRAARERLIEANLPLVVSIARKYEGRGLPFDDLVGEGCVGLIEAVERYDPKLGTRFGTYATFWIRKEVRLAIRSKVPLVRVPEHLFVVLGRWRKHESRLRRLGGPAPTSERVAQSMGLSLEKRQSIERAQAARSPFQFGGDDPRSHVEPVDHRNRPAEAILEEAEEKQKLNRCLARLSRRERSLLILRFGLADGVARSLKEVGRRLGVSRYDARNLERSALTSVGTHMLRVDKPEPAKGPSRSRQRSTKARAQAVLGRAPRLLVS